MIRRRPASGLEREGQYLKWVTRAGVRIDRVSSAWLIRNFVDPEPEFTFVPTEQVVAAAERVGGIPFDVPGVELGHHGPECAFDAIVHKYNVTDPAVQKMAMIVRGADSPNKDLTPESRGLDAL